jgi:hypothetical protein
MPHSLIPAPRPVFEYLLSRDKLPIHNEDLPHPIDCAVLVEPDGGFDVGVLLFQFVGEIVRIQVATELLDALQTRWNRNIRLLLPSGRQSAPEICDR